ncbi:pleckstrin homology domain-containing family B member 1-like [Diadema antillarum]|uniref:pleckstrin homology domain-containing family B member 1-like n=1 Tax=Diadema antillarum TaxID=105358 RepID=UPI003A8854D0
MATSADAASQNVIKAGWLQRESDILKKWKSSYCVLRTNGLFSIYTNERLMEAHGHINLPRECFVLKIGRDVQGVAAPFGRIGALIEIRTSQAAYIFCADTDDDAQTWKLVMDDVIRSHRAPPPAPAVMNAPPPAYVQAPPVVPPVVYASPPPVYQAAAPVTLVTPGTTSRVTSTTYYQDGRTVTVRQGPTASYPVQQTMYAYPGQTILNPGGTTTFTTYPATHTTTQVYRYN